MMVDTTIYGYVFDGWIACTDCASEEPYTRDRGAVFYDGSHDHGPECNEPRAYCERVRGYAVHSSDDDGNGMACEDCGGIIFDTSPEVDHDNGLHVEPRVWADECTYCEDYVSEHDQHVDALAPGEYLDDTCEDCDEQAYAWNEAHDAGGHLPAGIELDCPRCRQVRLREARTSAMFMDEDCPW